MRDLKEIRAQIEKLEKLEFNDRLTYLAYRQEWKTLYKELSVDIRKAKHDYKEQQRKIIVTIMNEGKAWQYGSPTIDGKPLYSCKEYNRELANITYGKQYAFRMMLALDEAKAKSREQRALSLAV